MALTGRSRYLSSVYLREVKTISLSKHLSGFFRMRIDVHTHIFPPDIVQDRQGFYDGEPAFRHLYDSPRARLATVESLLETMERDRVDRAVVFGFPWQKPELAMRHNDYVLESAAKYAPALIPLGCVNPVGPGSLREAERCLALGARGLGELAVYGLVDEAVALNCYQDLIACCGMYDGIMLVHANEPVGRAYPGKAPLGLDFYYALARMAAEIRLILAHWGGGLGFYELLKREAPEILRNVFYDTAASPFLYKSSMYTTMAAIVGVQRILFGSDYPLISPGRYFREMAETGISSEGLSAITGENASALFGITR
ncbi:MAG TPA: amidohydrolase family protein [Syntrophobacteraceae bacterium]|nr:amidohydrolase family protein [Syntrophobacteraceae bacterium]